MTYNNPLDTVCIQSTTLNQADCLHDYIFWKYFSRDVENSLKIVTAGLQH